MPMLGVMSEIFEDEAASISGEEDFFSVASTMPFVAERMLAAVDAPENLLFDAFVTLDS